MEDTYNVMLQVLSISEEVAQGIFLYVYFIKLLSDFNSIPLSLLPDNWRIKLLLNSELPFLLNIHSYSF